MKIKWPCEVLEKTADAARLLHYIMLHFFKGVILVETPWYDGSRDFIQTSASSFNHNRSHLMGYKLILSTVVSDQTGLQHAMPIIQSSIDGGQKVKAFLPLIFQDLNFTHQILSNAASAGCSTAQHQNIKFELEHEIIHQMNTN